MLNIWKKFLAEEKFAYAGNPFFVKLDNGDIYPAIIHIYGTEQKQYAMYGVWTNENIAQQYGYHTGDRIYMTAKKLLPGLAGSTCACAAATDMGIGQGIRYGEKTYHYDEIINNKALLKDLAYAPEPVNSAMANKVYDQAGVARTISGTEIPNAPDNQNNDNGMGVEDCPDKDWYWGLFCACATKKVNPTAKTVEPSNFNDYRDYADIKMSTQQYDPTMYGTDQSVSPLNVSPDNPPVNPYLFNKECVLLNYKQVQYFDPFAPDAVFKIYRRYWQIELLVWNSGWHIAEINITDKMKHCLDEIKNVYDYYYAQKGRETDWNYVQTGSAWKKKWPHGGDIEVTVTNKEYLDSAWYIANPFSNYDPYEDYKTFTCFDDNTGAGVGPFRLIAMDHGRRTDSKNNLPEYKRYEGNWVDPINRATGYYNNKDWYVQWEYYILAKDKWGRKVTVGNLTLTSTLWVGEDEGGMPPPNYEFNGTVYNNTVTVGGTALLQTQNTYYDKNSQDYRTDQADIADRNKEEFEKAQAMREIARKIIVAEAYNLVMKTMYYLATHQQNVVGVASGVIYETSKRIENRLAQSMVYKLAEETYEGFKLWRRTMDVLKKIRDTYMQIGSAWDGVLYSVHSIADYYKNLDLTKIRLTNISQLLPMSNFADLDYNLNEMKYALGDFTSGVHALCIETDSLTHGNYGPLNPVIRIAYEELNGSIRQTGANTTDLIDRTNGEAQALANKTQKTESDQFYLSNITRSTYNIIANQRLKVINNGTRNMALALYITEAEAKSWISYSRYMKMVVSEGPEKFKIAGKNPSTDNWENCAILLRQDRIFDEPLSQYFENLANGSAQ